MLEGYEFGLFPWNDSDSHPVGWWSPQSRSVLLPNHFHTSRSFKKFLRKSPYQTSFDQSFNAVVRGCAERETTWITPNMKRCYTELHTAGYAHSVEVWDAAYLVGGIFGISVGRIFIGESMFSRATNASKVALKTLLDRLHEWEYLLLDAQMPTPHLTSLGSIDISKELYLRILKYSRETARTLEGHWNKRDCPRPWTDASSRQATNELR